MTTIKDELKSTLYISIPVAIVVDWAKVFGGHGNLPETSVTEVSHSFGRLPADVITERSEGVTVEKSRSYIFRETGIENSLTRYEYNVWEPVAPGSHMQLTGVLLQCIRVCSAKSSA